MIAGCKVYTTVEIVIAELPGLSFDRPIDPVSGDHELRIQPR